MIDLPEELLWYLLQFCTSAFDLGHVGMTCKRLQRIVFEDDRFLGPGVLIREDIESPDWNLDKPYEVLARAKVITKSLTLDLRGSLRVFSCDNLQYVHTLCIDDWWSNIKVAPFDFPALTVIGKGGLAVYDTHLKSLTCLRNVVIILGDMHILDPTRIATFDDFESLKYIGGNVRVTYRLCRTRSLALFYRIECAGEIELTSKF